MYYLFILMCYSVLLVSCSNEKEEVGSPREVENPFVFKHNEQEFKINNYFQEFEVFLEKAEKQPDKLEKLYKESVIEVLRENGIGYNELSEWMFITPIDVEALEKSVVALIDKQDLINTSIKEALSTSSEQLPGGNKTIHVMPAIPEFSATMKEMKYVTGEVRYKNSMLILIDPAFSEEDLKHTIVHEYHHLIVKENGYDSTLLDRSVTEGKADLFAKMQYPDTDVPWIEPLTGYSKEQGWKLFMENLDSTDTGLWYEFTNGNHYKGLDKWSNYKIGYQIMESFLKENPNVTIEEWTKMPAEDILLNSEYKVK
ncbi:DUF2268 domain-containing putative Zn-dependent protease [Psychrobacillus sp.]|uniref:DUF2268 domain-containing protein n=1 Tax=Psychrobacillus sp. TaxID=1871623 RepID=UPI0028BEFE77|nr:DUF2268 domain-containing putative Zn-dependent protease [Psychrobacillus sp.]